MVPIVLKELFVPGSFPFFLFILTVGTLLLYRKKARAGRFVIAAAVALYWMLSMPATAVGLIRLLTPEYPPVQTREQARGATGIVVLGAGFDMHRSRGDLFEASSREDALRMMEAARVYRVLDRPWVVVTGGLGSERHTQAERMAEELKDMGIPGDRIVQEGRSTNTHDHAVYVPPLLRERRIGSFVLVTSRQHIDRALRVFRKAGWNPVPSSPEVYVNDAGLLGSVLPSKTALLASEELVYDKLGIVYYWLRGWV
jgi:uncharacterized SAM-binding protein YcdF (DUF218 family)